MFKPTQDYLLVKPVERKHSDVLSVISREKYTQGVIIAVGPGKKDKKGRIKPLDAKPGDFITYGDLVRGYDFYPKYLENGIEYRILQEADIAFIAEPEHEAHGFNDQKIADLLADARTLELS